MTNGYGNAPGYPGTPAGQAPVTPGAPGYGAPAGQAPVTPGAPGYGAPAGQPTGASPLSAQGVDNARQMSKWMKFYGIIMIVMGAMYCASIAGALVGWLPILLGWWKLKAANDILQFAEAGDVNALESGINNLRLHYFTMGIMMIISLSLMALMILGYILMIFIFGVAVFGAAASANG